MGTDEISQGAGPCQSRGPGMGSELTHIGRRAEEGEPAKEMEKQLKEEGLGPKQNTGKSKLSQLTLS